MSPAPRARTVANSSNSISSCLLAGTRASAVGLATLGQLLAHIIEVNVAFDQQHEQVIKQVRGFRNQLLLVFVLGGDDGFSRFFADLFEDLVETFIKQVGRV